MSAACVLIRLSPELADQFPVARPGEGPPHVTVAYIPEADERLLADVSGALRTAALVEGPFSLALTGGLHLFPPNAEGETPICIAVQSEGLMAFRRRFIASLAPTQHDVAAAIDAAHGGYVPHATVRYAAPDAPLDVQPRPQGGMTVYEVELWAGDELLEVVPIMPASPRPISLTAADLSAEGPPAGVRVFNRGGYHQGRPRRIASEATVYNVGGEGERRVTLTPEILAEVARVFEARAIAGEFLPKFNYNHRPSDGAEQPVFFGVVLAMFTGEDERGVGLYAVPGWTDAGRAHIELHTSPDGTDSVLYSSPELRFGPRYARSEGDGATGKLLGTAECVGVALTEYPAQSEGLIDPVTLSAHTAQGGTMPGQQGAQPPKPANLTGDGAAPATAPATAPAGQNMEAAPAGGASSEMEAIKAEQVAQRGMLERALSMLDKLAAQPPAGSTEAPADMAADGGAQPEDEKKSEDMAAALSAAEASKDPTARALAASLRHNLKAAEARKQAEAAKARTDAEKASNDRLAALEAQLSAERNARHEDKARAEVERRIELGHFTPAEREKMVRLHLSAHPRDAANLSAEAKGTAETFKGAWETLCADRERNPAVNMSAKGSSGGGSAGDGEKAFNDALEAHAKAHNLSGDYREQRMHFRQADPETYARLMAGWK